MANQTKAQLKNTIKQLKQNNKKNSSASKRRQALSKKKPAGRTSKTTTRVPASFANTLAGSPARTRFTNSERLIDVAPNGTSFNVQTKLVNSTCVPWLAKVASLYDKYKFHKLQFRYVTFSGTNIPGEINMSFDFDPSDPAPQDMIQACNNAVYKSTAACKNAVLNVPVKSAGNNEWKYTSDSARNENRIVDTGNLFISTKSFQADAPSPGVIYIDYDIELVNKSSF
jgi:hypothetical protein